MIRIYDSQTRDFSHNGLGTLDETIAAVVGEELNGSYEMEMEYPLSGRHFDKIQLRNIIFCKPNPHSNEQPFRIYSITKPLNGVVIINAEHISYDANGTIILPKRKQATDAYIVTSVDEEAADDVRYTAGWLTNELEEVLTPDPEAVYIIKTTNEWENFLYVWNSEETYYSKVEDTVLHEVLSYGAKTKDGDGTDGYYLDSILAEINNYAALQSKNYFSLVKDPSKDNTFKEEGFSIPQPMSLRSILGGTTASLLETFEGEFIFDNFDIILTKQRGTNRGITIRYGKNLTEMEHEDDGSNLFTGIFPFYSKNYTETYTSTDRIFQPCYIIPDVTPLRGDWLATVTLDASNGIGGVTIKPIVETVQILIEGLNNTIEKLVAMQIKTPNPTEEPITDYYDKLYAWKQAKVAEGTLISAHVNESRVDSVTTEVEGDDVVTETVVPVSLTRVDDGTAIVLEFGIIYQIKTTDIGIYNNNYIYDYVEERSQYELVKYDHDGFYIDCVDANSLSEEKQESLPFILPSWKIRYVPGAVEGEEWIRDDLNGIRVVRPLRPNVGTVSVDKFVYLDLLNPEVYVPEDKTDAYIRDGVDPEFASDWLSATEGGDALIPDSDLKYVIKTVGDYENLFYTWDSTDKVFTQVFDSILEDGIIYVNQTLKDLDVQKILPVDLTSVLDAIGGLEPNQMTQKHLFNKAEKHMLDNDYSLTKESLEISFIKLSESPEYEQLKELEVVILGDDVNVIYEKLGVDTVHRVISTEYDVLTNSYTEIELGEKKEKITNSIVTTGDNLSSLNNDTDYGSKEYITKLVADNAEIVNAAIQNAIIENLTAVSVDISGSLKASSATIDSLVASLFKADSAEVAKALIAGTVKVKGDLTLDSGSITINRAAVTPVDAFIRSVLVNNIETVITYGPEWLSDIDGGDATDVGTIQNGDMFKVLSDGLFKDKVYRWNATLEYYVLVSTYVFSVDREGNVIANNLIITGGSLDIGDNFRVSNAGIVTAKGLTIIDGDINIDDAFKVSRAGVVDAKSITIEEATAEKLNVSEELIANELTVNKIFFNDGDVSLERVTEGGTVSESQVVSVINSTVLGSPHYDYDTIQVTVFVDNAPYENKVFSTSVDYTIGTGITGVVNVPVTIIAGQFFGSGSVNVNHPGGELTVIGQTATVFPRKYSESQTTGDVETDKLIIRIGNETFDIITGVVTSPSDASFYVQVGEPAGTDFKNNALLFDIDPS